MDINDLLISQDYSSSTVAVEVITQVQIRRPYKTEFVRVRREDEFSVGPIAIYEDQQYRCTYLIDKALLTIFDGYFNPAILVTTISRQGALFLWPLKLPKINGRDNAWFQTAREAAEMAKESWIKVMPDFSLKKYKITNAINNLDEPKWPVLSFEAILKKVLANSLIDNEDHPVIQRLQGRI